MTFEQFRERFGAQGMAGVSKDQLTLLQQHKDDPSQRVGDRQGVRVWRVQGLPGG